MLFNSWTFCAFLAVVLVLYPRLEHRAQNRFLLLASYVFYGWWDWRFLSLILVSTGVDYWCAIALDRARDVGRRRGYLLVSLAVNLGILGFFKYYGFFVDSMRAALSSAGLTLNAPLLEIVLPVGVSFYTFQTLSYTIDVYRRQRPAVREPLDMALYVAFFPQLVAGPIERSTHLLPQIQQPRGVTARDRAIGAQLMLVGYVKKVVVADSVAPVVDELFAAPAGASGLELLAGVYLFAIQIYGDFSGYTDIARGVARLLGFDLCRNFRQPYLAANITDFWRRWHISLSTWLRDYLYIPLGGNRHGTWKTYRNVTITMLLGGLWHGAAWTFVIWGGLHGAYLAIHKLWRRGTPTAVGESTGAAPTIWLRTVATFHLVCLAWVFFRAPTLGAAVEYLTSMTAGAWLTGTRESILAYALFFGAIVLALDVLCRRRDSPLPIDPDGPDWARGLAYASMLALLLLIGETNEQPFIYFQF